MLFKKLCFIRGNHMSSENGGSIELIAHNARSLDGTYMDETVELSMLKYQKNDKQTEIVFLHVYNHPCGNKTMRNFENEFDNFMNININWVGKKLVVLGDFNIDFNREEGEIQRLRNKLESNYKLKPLLTKSNTRPKSGRQIDWVFSTETSRSIWETSLYTTWFSDHLPIVTRVNSC